MCRQLARVKTELKTRAVEVCVRRYEDTHGRFGDVRETMPPGQPTQSQDKLVHKQNSHTENSRPNQVPTDTAANCVTSRRRAQKILQNNSPLIFCHRTYWHCPRRTFSNIKYFSIPGIYFLAVK